MRDYQALNLKGLDSKDEIPDLKSKAYEMKPEIVVVYTDESAHGRSSGKGHAKSKKYPDGVDYTIEIFQR